MRVSALHRRRRSFPILAPVALALLLGGCSPKTDEPAAMTTPVQEKREAFSLVWKLNVGAMHERLRPTLSGEILCTISYNGTVVFTRLDGRVESKIIMLSEDGGSGYSAGLGCNKQYVAAVRKDGRLVVANRQGDIVWEKDLKTRVFGSPLISKGRLYVLGLDGRLVAYTVRQGNELWRYVSPVQNLIRTPLDSSPIEVDGQIYAGIDNGILVAIRAFDGKVSWENAVASPVGTNSISRILDVTTPASYDGAVCASAYQSGVGCFQSQNGTPVWTGEVETARRVALSADGTRLYASAINGDLHAFDARTGDSLWRVKTKHSNLSAPVFVAGAVVVGDGGGRLYAYSADDGELINEVNLNSDRIIFLQAVAGENGADVYGLTLRGDLFVARMDA